MKRKKYLQFSFGLIFLGIIILFIIDPGIHEQRSDICKICGTHRFQKWFMGIQTVHENSEDEVNPWIQGFLESPHAHNWEVHSNITSNIFNRLKSCGVGHGYDVLVKLRNLMDANASGEVVGEHLKCVEWI